MTPKLPPSLVINNLVHICHYRDAKFIIYQNYSGPRATSSQPLQDRTPGIAPPPCLFHVFRIEHDLGAETLGAEVGAYSNIDEAMGVAARTP
jgi:hypothetical protein